MVFLIHKQWRRIIRERGAVTLSITVLFLILLALCLWAIRIPVMAVSESVLLESRPEIIELKTGAYGRILVNNMFPGKKVSKGELLLELDSGDRFFRLKNKRIQIKALEQESTSLETILGGDHRRLHYDAATLEQQHTRRNSVEKEMLSLRKEVSKLVAELEARRLRAPFDGVLGMVVAYDEGAEVPTDKHVASLIPIEETRFSARFSKEDAATMKEGQVAWVRMQAPRRELHRLACKVAGVASDNDNEVLVFLDPVQQMKETLPARGASIQVKIQLDHNNAFAWMVQQFGARMKDAA